MIQQFKIIFIALTTDWVVALGPETFGDEGLYEWSIVADELKLYNFVLARDVERYYETFEDEVNAILEQYGFTGFVSGLRETYQESDCQYASPPE